MAVKRYLLAEKWAGPRSEAQAFAFAGSIAANYAAFDDKRESGYEEAERRIKAAVAEGSSVLNLNRLKREAGVTVVVPIILEECRWEPTALGKLNALPEKARPVTLWKPPSGAWKTVADGLAKVLKKLMEKGREKGQR